MLLCNNKTTTTTRVSIFLKIISTNDKEQEMQKHRSFMVMIATLWLALLGEGDCRKSIVHPVKESPSQLHGHEQQHEQHEPQEQQRPASVMSINHDYDSLHKHLGGQPDYHQPDDSNDEISTITTTKPKPNLNLGESSKKLFCRYDNQAALRPDKGRLLVSDLEPSLCTHIIYGSFGLINGCHIQSMLPEVDFKEDGGLDSLGKLAILKRNTQLKTIMSVGGSKVESSTFSNLVADSRLRHKFVQNVTKFLEKYEFDGLELDWNFPGDMHGNEADKRNYVLLMRELRKVLRPKGLWLSAQVGAVDRLIEAGYQVLEMSELLDSIHLMTYDYRERLEPLTGLLAPLYASMRYNTTKPEDMKSNVNWSVNKWLELGTAPEKLMLGLTYYGRTFMLDRASVNGLYAPANEPAQMGAWTSLAGYQGYVEFCEELAKRPSAWTVIRDHAQLVPYAFANRLWITYEDRESVADKVDYVLRKSMGGVVVNSLDTDDYLGQCHSHLRYPLTKTIKSELAAEIGAVSLQEPTRQAKQVKEPSPGESSVAIEVARNMMVKDFQSMLEHDHHQMFAKKP